MKIVIVYDIPEEINVLDTDPLDVAEAMAYEIYYTADGTPWVSMDDPFLGTQATLIAAEWEDNANTLGLPRLLQGRDE